MRVDTGPTPPTVTPSGVYTPTLTNVTNLEGSGAFACQYSRSGEIVQVSGKVTVNPTIPGLTKLGISLPIASNFALEEQCAGVAFASGIAGLGGAIIADPDNDRAQLTFIAVDVSDQPMHFQFSYRVI